jgi:hypothetical protein
MNKERHECENFISETKEINILHRIHSKCEQTKIQLYKVKKNNM